MDVLEVIEAYRGWLMRVGLSALGLCLVVLLGCAIPGKRRACRLPSTSVGSGENAASPMLGRSVLVGIMLLAIVCTLFGGGKTRSGGALGERALPSVAVEEIAQWWSLRG